jgi:hypothetical protein
VGICPLGSTFSWASDRHVMAETLASYGAFGLAVFLCAVGLWLASADHKLVERAGHVSAVMPAPHHGRLANITDLFESGVEPQFVIVLASSCGTCGTVLRHADGFRRFKGAAVLVVVAPGEPEAASFMSGGTAVAIPFAIDIGGTWSTSNLGIDFSPAVVYLVDGRSIDSTYTFGSFDSLRNWSLWRQRRSH